MTRLIKLVRTPPIDPLARAYQRIRDLEAEVQRLRKHPGMSRFLDWSETHPPKSVPVADREQAALVIHDAWNRSDGRPAHGISSYPEHAPNGPGLVDEPPAPPPDRILRESGGDWTDEMEVESLSGGPVPNGPGLGHPIGGPVQTPRWGVEAARAVRRLGDALRRVAGDARPNPW